MILYKYDPIKKLKNCFFVLKNSLKLEISQCFQLAILSNLTAVLAI